MKRRKKALGTPTLEQLEKELRRSVKRSRFATVLQIVLYSVVSLVAAAILAVSLWLPILQVQGTAMAPNYLEDELLLCIKSDDYLPGDVVAFYHNDRIVIRRVIATAGCWVHIDEAGNVNVDGMALEEPYLTEKSLGQCNRELPCQVPDVAYFVMGDNRAESIDSRSSALGCISQEQIIGKVIFRIWPFQQIGPVQ